jgi:hypothetical protein
MKKVFKNPAAEHAIILEAVFKRYNLVPVNASDCPFTILRIVKLIPTDEITATK